MLLANKKHEHNFTIYEEKKNEFYLKTMRKTLKITH